MKASVELAAQICKRWNLEPNGATIQPHRAFRATRCPADFPVERYIDMVEQVGAEQEVGEPQNREVRLFDPRTNEPIGVGTLVAGTDKVYIKSLNIDFTSDAK